MGHDGRESDEPQRADDVVGASRRRRQGSRRSANERDPICPASAYPRTCVRQPNSKKPFAAADVLVVGVPSKWLSRDADRGRAVSSVRGSRS